MIKPNLLDAARAGDPRAQLALAHFMIIGRAPKPSPEEPLRLVLAACAQKFDEAFLYRATLLALGIGGAQNFADAYACVSEAAALGHVGAQAQVRALGASLDAQSWLSRPEMKQHASSPRIFTVENFLPLPACEWLIAQGSERLHRALVQTGSTSSAPRDARTNSVAGSSMLEPDLVIQLTRLRIAAAIEQTISQLEPTNVLRYEAGQEYKPHYDIIRPDETEGFEADLRAYGQRLVTVLVYLNEGYGGGETEFPHLQQRFKGGAGDALIFWNLSAANEIERASLHAGLPVTHGEKWLLSQWVRQRPLPLR